MSSPRLARIAASVVGLLLALVIPLALTPAWAGASPAPTGTIQSLIDAAPDGGTVNVPDGVHVESLTVNKTLSLTGVSSATTIIQAVASQRVITVTAGHNLRLVNVAIIGGHPTSDVGGGVYLAGGSLTLSRTRISDNSALYGGGIFQEGAGSVSAVGSRIEQNTTSNHGGGLYVRGSAALTDTQVLSNTADGHGGGLHVNNGSVSLSGGLFRANVAQTGNGGAVNTNGDLNIENTQFISNSAVYGGALTQWNAGPQVRLWQAWLERNFAAEGGGGAYISGTLSISYSTFISNSVGQANAFEGHGGGIYAGGAVSVLASNFIGNRACESCIYPFGGGIYALQPVTIASSTFDSNQAAHGGGAVGTLSINPVSVTDAIFRNNRARYGGAIFAQHIDAANTDFEHNVGSTGGGALNGGVIYLSRVWLSGNSNPGTDGGGALLVNGILDASNVLMADNTSAYGAAIASYGADMRLRHVTIASTAHSNEPAVAIQNHTRAALTNTIISNYTVGVSLKLTSTLSADYDLFDFAYFQYDAGNSVITQGAHMRYLNPRFANPGAGDYHLAPGSPAIDAGTNLGIAIDLDGKPRPMGRGYDIGAYEAPVWVFLPMVRR